jgi:hypothetical protein
MIYLRIFEEFSRNYIWKKCADCNSENPEDYWFNDWEKVIPKSNQKKYICVSCLEKRVGRKLRKSDFQPWTKYYIGQKWFENLED